MRTLIQKPFIYDHIHLNDLKMVQTIKYGGTMSGSDIGIHDRHNFVSNYIPVHQECPPYS